MRVLIISDIHSNLEALEACLVAAPPYDIVVNLGDVVGYCASPNEVIERSRQLGEVFVRGNHDKAVCGLMDLDEFNPIASEAALWTRAQLTTENLDWLRKLPQGPIELEELPGVQFVHGSPIDEDEYLVSLRDALEPMMISTVPLTFFGHTHLQGSFCAHPTDAEAVRPTYKTVGQSESCEVAIKPGTRYLVNPGSIGQPRDGDWRAGFAMFDSEANIVTYYRVPYNLKRAQERILIEKLPGRLATRLAAGR